MSACCAAAAKASAAAELLEDKLPTRKARQDSAKAPAMPQVVRQSPPACHGRRGRISKTWRPALATLRQGMLQEPQTVKSLIEERFNTLAWLGQTRQNPLQPNLILKLILRRFFARFSNRPFGSGTWPLPVGVIFQTNEASSLNPCVPNALPADQSPRINIE